MQELPTEVFTSDEVKQIEADYAKTHNGHCFDLMKKAGFSVFDYLVKKCKDLKEVWIFCGKGNNGGDGYVVASLLKEHSIAHRVFATGIPHEDTEASVAYEYYLQMGGHVEFDLPNNGVLPTDSKIVSYELPDVAIDALLGTGIEMAPQGATAKWIKYVNQLQAYTISVDVPSGVVADTGAVPGVCIKAHATICMLALKPGLITGDGVDFVGEVFFSNLGLNISGYSSLESFSNPRYLLPIRQVTYKDIKDELPFRCRSFNKSDSGKVLIISGKEGMGGAAIMAGIGALRSGAGLVKVATDRMNAQAMLSIRPELMSVDLSNYELVSKAISWSDVVAIGPGLGVNEHTASLMALLDDDEKHLFVYDADALNVLAKYEQNYYKENRILTPHPGEAACLLGESIEQINQDRILSCYKIWQKYGGVVLLKGPGTVICDGEQFTIINEGSEALATGGSGDLLTGIIVSLLGQGLDINAAAIVGACVHGRAGYLCGERNGVLGTLPLDLCDYVRELLNAKG